LSDDIVHNSLIFWDAGGLVEEGHDKSDPVT